MGQTVMIKYLKNASTEFQADMYVDIVCDNAFEGNNNMFLNYQKKKKN